MSPRDIVHQLLGMAQDAGGGSLYDVVTCALTPGEVRTDADFPIHVVHGPEALGTADRWSSPPPTSPTRRRRRVT